MLGYRRGACWDAMREGAVETGFWVWDSSSQSDFLWRDTKGIVFPVIYNHHDGGYIPSLRCEAFREGIEDWKYVLMLDDAIARAKKKGPDGKVVGAAAAFRAKCLSELDGADSIGRFRDAVRGHLLALHQALGEVDAEALAAVERD